MVESLQKQYDDVKANVSSMSYLARTFCKGTSSTEIVEMGRPSNMNN